MCTGNTAAAITSRASSDIYGQVYRQTGMTTLHMQTHRAQPWAGVGAPGIWDRYTDADMDKDTEWIKGKSPHPESFSKTLT